MEGSSGNLSSARRRFRASVDRMKRRRYDGAMEFLSTRKSYCFGPWAVDRIVEWEGPSLPASRLFPGIPEHEIRRYSPAGAEGRISPDGRLVMSMQFFCVRRGDVVALIDAGTPKGKTRTAARHDDAQSPVPETPAAPGVNAEDVSHVFFTHFHPDHIGRAALLFNGVRVPTFPRAEYIVYKKEFEFFFNLAPADIRRVSFEENILPLASAGLIRWAVPGDEIAGVRLHDAAGHTPGALLLELEGVNVWFLGDLFHHPAQIARPDWPSGDYDWDQEMNARGRSRWLARFAETDALLFAAHLGDAFRVESTAAGGFFPKRRLSAEFH